MSRTNEIHDSKAAPGSAGGRQGSRVTSGGSPWQGSEGHPGRKAGGQGTRVRPGWRLSGHTEWLTGSPVLTPGLPLVPGLSHRHFLGFGLEVNTALCARSAPPWQATHCQCWAHQGPGSALHTPVLVQGYLLVEEIFLAEFCVLLLLVLLPILHS